ncbi:iron-enterobactin transporter substrate-binding protein [Pectobacterium araliae]|uniref:Fe2+-enterobactin ABC transporter substrate-binding protein n=1 Tax=Pectobacterium araliae TaxID=3073862 RepID=A0AAN0KBX7_9GAMM|nr:Fe2+-enterobactin ABC transporter substrate-binding protein [Pectobacterium sp. MAFF 302110]GKW19561.1 iron-enterobactin transporter substrate-binding protein [Pectobacterium carotovorum subsp. carotovorum]
MPTCHRSITSGIGTVFFGTMLMLLVGCDNASTAPTSPSDAPHTDSSGSWPRTLQTRKGPLTLNHQPQRIVSTSITISGTLLAINAPLVASGATAPNSTVADEQGFFTQWSQVAKQRGVKPLYITEPNAEAIAEANPDLIVLAATGGDSALKLYEQLSVIAPTLVIDYGDKSWQQLAEQLGNATGHSEDAEQIITQFEQRVKDVKQAIQLPPQPVSALVYYEDGRGVNLWTAASAQGKLLTALGFQLAALPAGIQTETRQGKRQDIVQISGENMAASLNGQSLLLFSTRESTVSNVMNNPFLSHLMPIQQKQVWDMGPDTFRLDYYSASNMLNKIETSFRKP